MPLLNHFNPPLNQTHPWRSFYGAWAAAMARLLNQNVLPKGYYVVPLGRPLPTLPLWIAADLAVPLDLEASYQATCADLRIRPSG